VAFRITLQSIGDTPTVIRLEGRLSAADLPVLESCLAEVGDEAISLDMAELRWLDPTAIERLAELLRGGARVIASSAFVDHLLARTDQDSPATRRSATHATESHGP
jgi:anti-anti-sigma regulatory factor